MVMEEVLFASISIAARALPLCAKGQVLPEKRPGLRATGQGTAWRFLCRPPLAHRHRRADPAGGYVTGLRFFVVARGFLLIIRGFVKVAVCNAGVIHQ